MSRDEELQTIWERLKIPTTEIITMLEAIDDKVVKESYASFVANAILASVSNSVSKYYELLHFMPKALAIAVKEIEKWHEKPSGERE
jgi:hypothetical protein